MKFALVNGERSEPKPKLIGKCPLHGCEVIAKCGPIKMWHWAHKSKSDCDNWKENETEWHRDWKNCFPVEWQEIPVERNGKKHRADVQTCHSWVIEFQHSYLNPEEINARETFYEKLVWVVDGRGKNNIKQFEKALNRGKLFNQRVRAVSIENSNLLKMWSLSKGSVFFDFGNGIPLWWLLPERAGTTVYLTPFPKEQFINIHLNSQKQNIALFEELLRDLPKLFNKK